MPKAREITASEAYRRYCLIRGWIGRTYPEGLSTLDQFAEYISGGPEEDWALPPTDAAREMGFKNEYGNALMQRLRKGIGERAI